MAATLHDLFIVPDIDRGLIAVSFTPPEGCAAAVWEVLDGGRTVSRGNAALKAGPEARFEAAVPGFKLWQIHDPHLYTLRLTLGGESVEQVFGMRTIRARGQEILVNGQAFCARGFIRGREAHDHPNLENLPLYEYYAKNIRAAKAYGFNLIRFHSRIPPQECFEAADKLGMFIHIEIRKYYGKYQKERARMSDEGEIISEADWKEAILALRNHPSLMVYCMGNEIRHPGTNPFVEHIANVTRKLDPTRLFLDTCAHGEFDREYVDFDVQHMSYFFPFGKDYDMFENTWNWLIYGSCKGYPLEDKDDPYDPSYRVTRAIPGRRPTLAHEICHYAAWRDLDALEEKFRRCGAEAPWWLAELRKLAALKKMDKDYALLREASKRFQFLGWKLGIEAARRSPLLCGFHFLQFSDTDRYENSNGVVDCFDDPSGVDEEAFLRFNGDTVLLADLPRRTFFEGEKVSARVLVSHFSPRITGEAVFSFRLETTEGQAVAQGSLGRMKMDEQGRRDLCRLDLRMPAAGKPVALRLVCKLAAESGETLVENAWNLWVYPNRPAALAAPRCTVALEGVNLGARYPQLKSVGSLEKPAKLLIANRFSKAVLDHLGRGGNVLMLYRVEETRDRKYYKRGERPARETYYLPASWDRLKGVIWDRGTNCGAVVRDNKAFDGFPNDGFLDLQFHALIDDSDKICLDDFPADVTPLMQGVDKAARDRFDVHNFKLSELQPAYTMRKFAYAFEVRVGKGRLFVTGFNFTGLERGAPETCAMFESILGYVTSHRFKPAAAMTPEALEEYLLAKGRAPRIKEREMSQYWQLNDAPLESDRFWKEAQEYLREEE